MQKQLYAAPTTEVLELRSENALLVTSPPGWKVPIIGTWDGFNYLTAENEAAGTYTTVWADGGRYYYPEGYVKRETTGAIYIPASGCRHNSHGGLDGVGSNGFCWSASPVSAAGGYCFFSRPMDVFASYSYSEGRALGFSVRCVRE